MALTPLVFDVNGTQRDWAWLKAKYKCDIKTVLETLTSICVRLDDLAAHLGAV